MFLLVILIPLTFQRDLRCLLSILGFVCALVVICIGLALLPSSSMICGFGMGTDPFRPDVYTFNTHDLQKVKDYAKWVEGLPKEIDCGMDCLFYNFAPDDRDVISSVILESADNPVKPDEQQCLDIPLSMRFDCHPGNSPSRESCEAMGCCWKEETEVKRYVSLQFIYQMYSLS